MDEPIDPLESLLKLPAKERVAKLGELKERLLGRLDSDKEEISLVDHLIMQVKIDLERQNAQKRELVSEVKVIDKKELAKNPQIRQIARSAMIDDSPEEDEQVHTGIGSEEKEEILEAVVEEDESESYNHEEQTDEAEVDEEDNSPLDLVVQKEEIVEDTAHEEEHDEEDLIYFVAPSAEDLTQLFNTEHDSDYTRSDISNYLVDEPEYVSLIEQDSYPDVSDEIDLASEFLLQNYPLETINPDYIRTDGSDTQ